MLAAMPRHALAAIASLPLAVPVTAPPWRATGPVMPAFLNGVCA
jgi:hypothetical protein